MKKAGERVKSFSIHALFIILVAVGLYFIVSHSVSLTGHVVLDADTARTKLETAFASSSVFGAFSTASFCIIINDAEDPATFNAVSSGGSWTVVQTTGFCNGLDSDDLVVQFADYDSFSKVVDNPTPRALASAAKNRDFEILPSRYVEAGGNVLCDSIFRMQYCSALKTMGSSEELIDGDLSCCVDDLTRSQKKLLEQHLAAGSYEDEIKALEQPGIAGLPFNTSIIVLVVVVIIVLFVIIAAFAIHGKKPAPAAKTAAGKLAAAPGAVPSVPGAPPAQAGVDPGVVELGNYVKGVIASGYPHDEVRAHLLQIGWDAVTADKVIAEAQQANAQGK
ncbi:hypothetical protein ACFL3V_07320 [Nanoarchaeota archaeon]